MTKKQETKLPAWIGDTPFPFIIAPKLSRIMTKDIRFFEPIR